MGEKNDYRLPETAMQNSDCFQPDFMFHREAKEIALKIEEILDSFVPDDSPESPLYSNNVIGILGGRGTGKTSLMASLSATLSKHPKSAPFEKPDDIKVYPLFKDIIDPKVLPDCIGIADLTISALFNDFKEWVSNCGNNEDSDLDDRIGSLYDEFEKIGKDIQTFYTKDRKDAIGGPSDLYEISGLTKIRSGLEGLVSRLLKLKNGANSSPKMAFLLIIDDFDLDFSNCYQMVFDIVSLLNIKGLVILLALDEETFKYEFVREMIKKQSDFGPASSALLERVGPESRPISRSGPRYFAMNVVTRQEKYFEQVYNKFIPLDFRFRTKGHDFNEMGGKAFQDRFSDFCEWLFGFKPSWRSKKNEERRTLVERFYTIFFDALSERKDLRIRNQGINRILSLWQAKITSSKTEIEVLEELSAAFEAFAQSATTTNQFFWNKLIDSIDASFMPENERIEQYKSGHRASALDIPEGGKITIYEIGKGFFAAHPAAYGVYEVMINFLSPNPNTWSTLLEDYGEILKLFVDGNETISIVEADPQSGLESGELLKVGHFGELDTEALASSLFDDRKEMLIRRIDDTIRLYDKATKTNIRVLVALIELYVEKQKVDASLVMPFIEEVKDALEMRWKNNAQTKSASIRRIFSALRMIRRRL